MRLLGDSCTGMLLCALQRLETAQARHAQHARSCCITARLHGLAVEENTAGMTCAAGTPCSTCIAALCLQHCAAVHLQQRDVHWACQTQQACHERTIAASSTALLQMQRLGARIACVSDLLAAC